MIYIMGVSHIQANESRVIEELEMLKIDSDSLVFIEPKRNLITGYETYKKGPIMQFFNTVIGYISCRKARIVPLNGRYMPSHHAKSLFYKYAMQLSEEEYMTQVISDSSHEKDIFAIIGNLHADRLSRLLSEKGITNEYISACPITPDDMVAESIRAAIEGRCHRCISVKWLELINQEIATRLNLPSNKVQELCWEDPKLFREYLKAASKAMLENKAEDFLFSLDRSIIGMVNSYREELKDTLIKNRAISDHSIVESPFKNTEKKVSAA